VGLSAVAARIVSSFLAKDVAKSSAVWLRRDPTSTTAIVREVQRNARREKDGSASIVASQLDTVETGCGWLLSSDSNHQPHLYAGNGAPDVDIRGVSDDIGRQTTVLDALNDGGCCVVVRRDQQCHAGRTLS